MDLILPASSSPGEDPSALWTVQLQLLDLAENTLGPRDDSIRICRPVFSDDGPHITLNFNGTFAELSRNAEEYWPAAVYELAHETVHLLNPKPGVGNWLSEGIAVAFSDCALLSFKLEPYSTDMQSYRRALDLVSELPRGSLAAGCTIRDAYGSLESATQSKLEALFPSVESEILSELSKPFVRDWFGRPSA